MKAGDSHPRTDPPSDEPGGIEPFSMRLEAWLKGEGPHTLGSLEAAFGEKSFAVTVLLLMLLPALPLPTGGVSHAFEVIAALLAVQMVAGRTVMWLPRRWQERQLGGLTTGKAIPLVSRWVHRLEAVSRPRGRRLLQMRTTQRLIGLSLVATSLTALTAPPFSGLDTLPGVAAVLICLGVILEDVALAIAGVVVETAGIVVIVTIGAAAAHWISHLIGS